LRHTVVRRSPFSPDQLFDLVGDVGRYPEFVPWITSMRLWNARQIDEVKTAVDAEAGIGFSFLKEKFSTRVHRDALAREITVRLIRGPFHHLINRWRFSPEGAGTTIEFVIDFEFKTKLLDRMLTANFERAVSSLMRCFDDRARALYGERPAVPD
jgi:coenzyme Q-binding protein COQ10